MLGSVTKVIGLTGPIGAGKSEAARILRRHGFSVIDADRVAHDLYGTQSEVWHGLVKCCGSKILNRGGRVNRKKLAEVVFSDKRKLAELDRIIHPYLKEAIIQIAEKQKAKRRKPIVINAAVLKEIGLLDYVDEVWVVMAPIGTRLKRLIRSGLSRAEAEKRMRAQVSQAEYLKMADKVIQNEGSLVRFKKRIGSLI